MEILWEKQLQKDHASSRLCLHFGRCMALSDENVLLWWVYTLWG